MIAGTEDKRAAIEENRSLRREFKALGLDTDEVMDTSPERPEEENQRMESLLEWVYAYKRWPSRTGLEERGFMYPPIEPGFDPDNDWLIFESWMQGKPVTWTFEGVYGRLTPPENLSNHEIPARIIEMVARLAERGVHVDLQEGVPQRLTYSQLREYLMKTEFEIMTPGVTCHIGCIAYCPECFQRPWCDMGKEERWPEDDDAKDMAVPDACKPYIRT